MSAESKILTIKIDSLAFGGRGVGRTGGLVCFVDDALPGEEVLVEVVKTKKRFLEAKLIEVRSSSLHRKKPLCPYYGECGGCQYQTINYQEELKYKSIQVRDSLKRVGGIQLDKEIKEIVPSPKPYYYRNSLDLRVMIKDKKACFAFIHRNNKDLVFVERCVIAEEKLNSELRHIQGILESMRLEEKEYTLRIKEDSKNVFFCLSDLKNNKIIPEKGDLIRRLGKNKVISYLPDSFFQSNWGVTRLLIDEIRKRLSGLDAETLFDLYCGTGLFSIALSQEFQKIIGIEQDKKSFQLAVQNAKDSNIDHTLFYHGSSERILPKIWNRFDYEKKVILLDPPRKGCHESLLNFLIESKKKIARIFYVSCDPTHLAGNLRVLANGGFIIEEIIPFDMFPRTKHIETLAILK